MHRALPLLAATVLLAHGAAAGCNVAAPAGIDDGTPGAYVSGDLLLPPPEVPLFGIAIQGAISALGKFETPIQFYLIQMTNLVIYNFAAAYHPTALDHFGNVTVADARRRCQDAPNFDLHRRVGLAHALYDAFAIIPEAQAAFAGAAAGWGLDLARCENNPSDPVCADVATPWGLAWQMRLERDGFRANDGWNFDGSYNRMFNKIPYEDWRDEPYRPMNDPYTSSRSKHYAPLLEDDGRGFMFHQVHVTPHIGQTARSILLGDDDICRRKAPVPDIRYRKEDMDIVLERTGALDDKKKMEVEFFDSKLTSVVPLQVQWFARQGISLDSFEFILADSAVISVLYESVIVVWKEKVRHDRVRPPTIISHYFGELLVNSYAGPFQGTQDIPAKDWQPYIRTMPHAEYPSGSSCVCSGFREAMKVLTGTDDVTATLNGPLAQEVPAGSSRLEPGATPASDLLLTYGSWSEIADACGRSRVDGGMHFEASIPAGDDLCAPIGTVVANAFLDLVNGTRPSYMVDPTASNRFQKRCNN